MNIDKIFSRLFQSCGLFCLGLGVAEDMNNKDATVTFMCSICCLLLSIIHYFRAKEK